MQSYLSGSHVKKSHPVNISVLITMNPFFLNAFTRFPFPEAGSHIIHSFLNKAIMV